MTLESLDNLVRINQLKREPSDQREFEGLVKAAIDRLTDAQNETLSFSSRFDLAYSAAHGLALSALRAAGDCINRLQAIRHDSRCRPMLL